MRKYLSFLLLGVVFSLGAAAQTASVFPAKVPTDSDLLIANNLWETQLSAPLSAASMVVPVLSSAGLKVPTAVTINSEIIKICGTSPTTLVVCPGGRAFDGSTIGNHPARSKVQGLIIARYHNQLAAEIKAITQGLGTDFSGLMRSVPTVPSNNSIARYDASQKKYKPSSVTIDDNGAITAPGGFIGTIYGSIDTANRLANPPTPCTSGQYAYSIDQYANLGCKKIQYSELEGVPNLGYTSPLTAIGDTLWRSSSGDARVPGNPTTTKLFYTQSGNGAVPSIPQWLPVTEADLPSSFLNTVVRTSRQVSTGYGLTGGGDLSSNRTISVVDGSTIQKISILKNSLTIGAKTTVNFVDGSGVQTSVEENGDRVDVTISSTLTSLPPSGAAGGDLSGSYPAPSVASIGGRAVSSVISSLDASAADLAAATNLSTPGTLMKRDASGNVQAVAFVGSLQGNASTATEFLNQPSGCTAGQFATGISKSGNLTCQAPTAVTSVTMGGDVTGLSSAAVVERIRGYNVDFSVAPVTGQVLGFAAGGQIVPVNAPAPSEMPYANLTLLPAALNNMNNGRIRMLEVGCSSAWGSSCDANSDGWPDQAGSAPWSGITSKPASWLSGTTLTSSVSDFNTPRASGFYEASSATNAPEASKTYTIVSVRQSNTGSYTGNELALEYGGQARIWTRAVNAGSFGSWIEVPKADGRTYNLTAASASSLVSGYAATLGAVTTIQSNGSQFYGVHLNLATTAVGNGDGPKVQFTKDTSGGVKRWGLGFVEGTGETSFGVMEDTNSSSSYGTSRMLVYAGGDVQIPGRLFVGLRTNYADMQPGAMLIGTHSTSYGLGTGWNTSTAGLLLATNANQEIAAYHAATRLASLVSYAGATNTIAINRDMGWGHSKLSLYGDVTVHKSMSVLENYSGFQFRVGGWIEMSGSCAIGMVSSNSYLYWNGTSCLYKHSYTHADRGPVGMLTHYQAPGALSFFANPAGTADTAFTPALKATMSSTGNWGFLTAPTNDVLTVNAPWFDISSDDFGGGIRIVGPSPSITFFDTDNTGYKWMIHNNSDAFGIWRRQSGGNFAETLLLDSGGNMRTWGSSGVGGVAIDKFSVILNHGEKTTLRLPAASNGANTGNVDLSFWVSEPNYSWTGAGIARNMVNTNSGYAFPRANNQLSGQLIHFMEDGSIKFEIETAAGVRTTPLQINSTGVSFDRQFGWTVEDKNADLTAGTTETTWANLMSDTFTVSQVWCESNTGTAQIQLLRDDGSAANVLSAALTCGTTGSSTTSFVSGESVFSNGHKMDFQIVSAPSGTRRINVFIKGR